MQEMYKTSVDETGREVRALQPSERRRLLEVADDTGLGGITEKKRVTVRALLHTGMRAAELAHLRPSWLDDSEGIPMVRVPGHEPCDCGYCEKQARHNLDRWCRNGPSPGEVEADPEFTEDDLRPEVGSDEYERLLAERMERTWSPKSSSGSRAIPVHYPETWDLLADHVGDDDLGVGPHAIWKRVSAVNDHMDLEHEVTPHILRHSFCAMFAAEGEQLGNIAEMAGHKSVDTTRLYAKMTGHQVARQTAENAPEY